MSTDVNNFWQECCQESNNSNGMVLYFQPHLSSASALPGKTRKHKNNLREASVPKTSWIYSAVFLQVRLVTEL